MSSEVKNNETWNTCPLCGRDWKDKEPIPGVIHRTKICRNCELREEHKCDITILT